MTTSDEVKAYEARCAALNWTSDQAIHRTDIHEVYNHDKLIDDPQFPRGRYERLADEYRPEFWLDHQCDEWLIGGVEDAKRFVKRLQDLIDEVER